MKAIRFFGTLLLVTALVVNFSSCKNDDNEEENQSPTLVGTWNNTRDTYESGGVTHTTTRSYGQFMIVFNADGTCVWKSPSGNENCKYTLSNKRLTFVFSDNSKMSWDIEKLTNTELVLFDYESVDKLRAYYTKVH